MTPFELAEPTTLKDALRLLDPDDSTVRPVGGGTALMLMMKAGVFQPTKLVSLRRITTLSRIAVTPDGGLAIGAICARMELLLPIVGFIFVLEALSVVIQVGSYKLRKGKRVFKMAPIHHHFELSGWHERKVVNVFVSLTFVLCAICVVVLVIQSVYYGGA